MCFFLQEHTSRYLKFRSVQTSCNLFQPATLNKHRDNCSIWPTNTNLWCVRGVKKSELSECFVRWCVRAVWDRGAGSFSLVLDVGSLRWPSEQPRGFPRWRRAVGKQYAARWPPMRRGPKAIFVPQLHVVVPHGLVQGAAASFQSFVDGVPSHWHRGIHLRKARLPPGAVVNVLNRVIFSVAGCEL